MPRSHHRLDHGRAHSGGGGHHSHHSPNRPMPPEVLSIDEEITLLEENDAIGEIINERRRHHGSETSRRLVNPAVTIVEMTGIKASTSGASDKPLLTPLGEGKPPLGENNTANSTGE